LAWEAEHDCNKKLKEWILENRMASVEELVEIEKSAKTTAKKAKDLAWKAFNESMEDDYNGALLLIKNATKHSTQRKKLNNIYDGLKNSLNPLRLDSLKAVKKSLRVMRTEDNEAKDQLKAWHNRVVKENTERYNSHLYSESALSALKVEEVKPTYEGNETHVDGREVLQACFDAALARDPRVFAFGEDVGRIGDVNQAFAGLQAKYGDMRVTDTGIREVTIIGQGVGAALRGLRPIAEIYKRFLMILQVYSTEQKVGKKLLS
jgi:hypothetical protein